MQYFFFFFAAAENIHMFFLFFSSRRLHTIFDCDWSSDVCSSDLTGGELNSYGPRYTVGTRSQLPCGAGLGSVHSSPLSCHGFRPAGFPFLRLHQKFTKKMICVANSRNALIEMNTRIGW